MKSLSLTLPSLLASLMLATSPAHAETLNCRLYVSTSTNLIHKVDLPFAKTQLQAQRYVGTCHFSDGRVADKQFVAIQRVIGDGSTGTIKGYSTYSFNDKDSISLEFDGGWGSSGFKGDYSVISGSGSYDGAKGDGNFKSVKNEMSFNNVFDVTINLAK